MGRAPEDYSADLTNERITLVSDKLLDVLDEAENFAQSPNATAWFKGSANYGLPQGMLKRMHEDENYPWLTLANQTMDYTVKIGSTLVQFIVDDPHAPKKAHRVKRNAVERQQFGLDLEEHDFEVPLIWRFYLSPISNGVDYSPSVTLVGFDINENIVCLWEHEDVISSPLSGSIAQPVEIEVPVVALKQGSQKKQSSSSDDK
ncbi:hypothetical protein [uncultured Paraglaciecola sp.]|uniref:hypothetical protein n=1 Tax=uncultured Paraglaciecola sp. TaxID=1765024 RepID=UPI0030D775DD|tara:strand:- start:5163 stop:5771 length:609 start_codon:yes stop_codon:yes gene_type:complete